MTERSRYYWLEKIESPSDLKKLTVSQLNEVAAELRQFLIEVVSQTGGHLGSNLGSVELTIALHYIYEAPRDLIVWDVGAQAYAHKILTGRYRRFNTNRQYGGIAGFPRRDESPYDTFGVGHSSTSISAALGMVIARDLAGESHKVIAVIGDGGMTGGMAFEGLNHAGAEGRDLTVVLNDNRMAISPSVGALSSHLASLRAGPGFEKLKDSMWQLTGRLPQGSRLRKALHGVDAGIREMLIPGLWFERLGFRYVGPVDGHNIQELVRMFQWLRDIQGPVLIHVLTEKGKGYQPAEDDALHLHGVSKFDPATGPAKGTGGLTFASHFSDELLKLARADGRIVAITPAMIEGSALTEFQIEEPRRCFDVGIAEQHAVTFAAGLAVQGIKPVVAIYSTFFQRAYDQLIHDVALQNLPVVFGVDRAGLVGEDGPTHHGAFDLSYMRSIPNMTILIPRDSVQLRKMLNGALGMDGPVAIRFPRGSSPTPRPALETAPDVFTPEMLVSGPDGLVIGCGPILYDVLTVISRLAQERLNLSLLDIRCLKPLDSEFLTTLAARFPRWISIEENALMGGMGSALLEIIADRGLDVKLRRLGLPDRFVMHGDRESLLKECGLGPDDIRLACLNHFHAKPRRFRATATHLAS